MATIKDVARRAGTAPSTVSKYLNGGHVREDNAIAIREAIAALDYRVNPFARNLKTQRSHAIGILLPDMCATFWSSIVTALDKVLRENGYHSLISCYDTNHGLERDKLQFLLDTGVDGLVYIPENLTAEEFEELTANCGVPVVFVDRTIPGVHIDSVLSSNTDATYRAVSHLLESGNQQIGIISGPKAVFTAKERLVGYLRALSDHNISYNDSLVISGENDFATGYNGLLSLLELESPPTAILSTNYDITQGLITAARERGIQIPRQISVFGYDCVDICTMMTPPLPVVQQPEQELGRLAGTYIIERLGGCTLPPRITRLECKLVL